jgi:hypothetical protein
MAIRTIQIWGQGYGPDAVTANVTFNGNTVFSGQIPTIDSSLIRYLPADQTVLISFDVPVELSGTFPVSIEFNGSDAFVSTIAANYCAQTNPIYSQSDLDVLFDPASSSAEKLAIWIPLADPELTSEEIVILETGTTTEKNIVLAEHGLSLSVSTGSEGFAPVARPQCKINTVINGVAIAPPSPLPVDITGEWGWEIPCIDDVAVFNFDLIIDPGSV